MDVDVVGKGKRKVGDVPVSVANGSASSFFVLRCAYVCSFFWPVCLTFFLAACDAVGQCIADVHSIGWCAADYRSVCCTHTTGIL